MFQQRLQVVLGVRDAFLARPQVIADLTVAGLLEEQRAGRGR